jgi:hypothetical protein
MRMRGKHDFCVPSIYHATLLSPVPCTFQAALADPNW